MKSRLVVAIVTCLALPLLALVAPAQAQEEVWVAPTWGDGNFDENFPIAYVITPKGEIIVQMSAETLQWKTTIIVPSARRDIQLINVLSHADGSVDKLDTGTLAGGILQDPHDSGGLITTFRLDQAFVDRAKAADSWTVHVGLDRFVFPMTGSRAALDHVETVGYESNHAFVQEESDMEQALMHCAAAVAHPRDPESSFAGVAWGDIDASEAVARCEWAREMLPDNGQVLYLLGRAYDKAGDRRVLEALGAAADLGYGMAFNHLGIIYRDGEYGTDDMGHAGDLFRQGAEAGNILAQYAYAEFLAEFGDGAGDHVTALEYMSAAAIADYDDAALIVARWYRDGYVAEQDGRAAREFYEIAIEADHAAAAWELAGMYRDGVAVTKDPEAYLTYLKVAARMGHDDARTALAYD
ncbi:tetratricopeptide repeat protein [Shimia sediminis]|uniref:tetratricopeptide repeat protein n=1 Tax=Shimia sediminis TaxID=2497945 RepID=UPI000F8E5752|nr:tetratricopeptide repeat protein [Shimia sediminis]